MAGIEITVRRSGETRVLKVARPYKNEQIRDWKNQNIE
jgi:hypothetical protein